MNQVDALLKVLEAKGDVTGWNLLGHSLEAVEGEFSVELRQTLISALTYNYVESSEYERRERWGVYAPFVEFADGRVFPPPVESLSAPQLVWLSEIVRSTNNPALLSRINDLLWIRRYSDHPDNYARNSIKPYIELSRGGWPSVHKAECLVRALEIGLELKSSEIIEEVVAEILRATRVSLEQGKLEPGVSLRLIEAIDNLPNEFRPAETDELMDSCLHVYQSRPDILETVYELKANRASREVDKRAFQKARIDVWLKEAEKSKGIVKLANFRKAEELARAHGFVSELDQILKAIQSIPEEELELKTLEVTTTIPNQKIEEAINWYFKDEAWQDVLTRYGFRGPPSGSYEKNLSELKEFRARHPIQFLVSKIVLDDNNIPIKYIQTDEDHAESHLLHHEYLGITIFGTFATEILLRFAQKFPDLNRDQLTEFFTTKLIDHDIAHQIAIAVEWYLKGEFNISVHLLLPKIEYVIRLIAKELGLAVIRPPIGERPGGVLPLGTILNSLKGLFDESWRRYFINLLTDSQGANIRNRLLHGLAIEATKPEAALLIQAVCHLRLIELKPSEK